MACGHARLARADPSMSNFVYTYSVSQLRVYTARTQPG
jgi:hypothetical protein